MKHRIGITLAVLAYIAAAGPHSFAQSPAAGIDQQLQDVWFKAKPGSRADWARSVCAKSDGRLAPFLADRITSEPSARDRAAIADALGACGDRNIAVKALVAAGQDKSTEVRHAVVEALLSGRKDEADAVPVMVGLIKEGYTRGIVGGGFHNLRDASVREQAVTMLQAASHDTSIPISRRSTLALIAGHVQPKAIDDAAEAIFAADFAKPSSGKDSIRQQETLEGLLRIGKKAPEARTRIRKILSEAASLNNVALARKAKAGVEELDNGR